MFISKIRLDPRKRETARAIQNREILHGAIERSIAGKRPHILWRLEPDMSLLAITEEIPNWENVQIQFGDERTGPVCKPYESYIEAIENGQFLRFRLIVNPVINKSDGSKNGKDVPLNLRRTVNYPFSAKDWTKKKLTEGGADVIEIEDIAHETVHFIKGPKKIPIFLVTYSGIIRVRDVDLFKKIMRIGLGGKKSYGCGMVTVIRIRR